MAREIGKERLERWKEKSMRVWLHGNQKSPDPSVFS